MLGATKRLELPSGGRAMALQSIARNHAMQLQSSARNHAQPCIAAVPGSHFITASCCHAGEELADVLLYLVRLSDACGIDLAAAAEAKLRKNAGKRQQRCRRTACKHRTHSALPCYLVRFACLDEAVLSRALACCCNFPQPKILLTSVAPTPLLCSQVPGRTVSWQQCKVHSLQPAAAARRAAAAAGRAAAGDQGPGAAVNAWALACFTCLAVIGPLPHQPRPQHPFSSCVLANRYIVLYTCCVHRMCGNVIETSRGERKHTR